MGKKNKSTLGRSLIKDRFGNNRGRKFVSDNSMLHTTEIHDGYDWGRLNLRSVTEESSFQEFLSTAELAGTEFQAEKLNIKFVNPRSNVGLLSSEKQQQAKDAQRKLFTQLKIPRRPKWTTETTSEELQQNERDQFLEWRRSLATLQEEEGIMLTPYEKNLEFWRQLWRVVERSDVVVQIVDGRNPLLFRCEDLERYVKEVSEDKMNLILVNKADFLNDAQRKHWAQYFQSVGTRVVFFSAIATTEIIPEEETSVEEPATVEEVTEKIAKLDHAVEECAQKLTKLSGEIQNAVDFAMQGSESESFINNPEILSREELTELFRNVHKGPKVTQNVNTIGLVGYPNVGKSSTINSLMSAKKVSVSATPGKTKHFQTLFLDKDVLLCDCPGLVMPSFVFTKAEMILNGILPIDQMRDHVPPTNLVANLIPRHVIEDTYGIMLPLPMEGEDPDRSPFAEEILNAYAYNRGFMTANGQPDNARAARYLLKDFVNGKLLFAHAPPNVDQTIYHTWPERTKTATTNRTLPPREVRAVKPSKMTTEDLDKVFFRSNTNGVHVKGKVVIVQSDSSQVGSSESLVVEKPWKKINKHENKKKREKLRRVYAHLDQH